MAPTLPNWCFAVGGTHNVAHACHKILLAEGVKVWTHSEVEKFIIEDGAAKGIRLTDGTEIGARKLVVSAGLSPFQLVDMIGRERLSSKLLRRVDLLEDRFALLGWYTWALHEPPKYEAAQFNPDVNDAFWFALAQSADPEHVARECYWRRLAKMPPLEDYNPMIWCHSLVDPSYAPEGRHTANHEQLVIPLSALTEKGWMEFKKQHAEDIVTIWQWHAPNMTWDNIIGYDANTPYDHCRLKNCARNGCWSVIDGPRYQQGQFRPTPELANHRTPITNLYATGTAWHVGGEAGAQGGYNCYKIIAEDLGLGKPWLEPGKEEPGSLIQEWKIRERKLLESAKVKA